MSKIDSFAYKIKFLYQKKKQKHYKQIPKISD